MSILQRHKLKFRDGTATEQFTITVPKHIAKAKNWKGGERLEFYVDVVGQVILEEKEI